MALNVRSVLLLAAAAFVPALPMSSAGARAADVQRERISLDADWRFQKGDPAGAEGRLAYDKIKPWVNATGNEFARGPDSPKPKRPEGELGGDISYAQPGFDDNGWRRLNLPHDWGVEGPFDQSLPGETGKLPWSGVAWYRKHFTVPATDRGRQLYQFFGDLLPRCVLRPAKRGEAS